MATSKPLGLEIAYNADSGVIYGRTGARQFPKDVLTWQDFEQLRIWIHSRYFGNGFRPVSMEVQVMGEARPEKGVDASEAAARVALASIRSVDVTESRISHSVIRNLPIGQILQTNSTLVSNEQARFGGLQGRKLNLSDDGKPKYRAIPSQLKSRDHRNPDQRPIRASKADSILIAYMYSLLATTGNKKAASDTAKQLDIDAKFVYTALRNARKKGWLTTSGIGSTGGELTKAGLAEFERVGRESYEELLKTWMKDYK